MSRPASLRSGSRPVRSSNGWVLSPTRFLQVKESEPLQIAGVKADANNVTIQLANANKLTRVHVFATRFVPDFSPFGDLAVPPPTVQARPLAAQETVYESGRDIGDEYRYIIDRKHAAKFPGTCSRGRGCSSIRGRCGRRKPGSRRPRRAAPITACRPRCRHAPAAAQPLDPMECREAPRNSPMIWISSPSRRP